jgi:hypothetical protein
MPISNFSGISNYGNTEGGGGGGGNYTTFKMIELDANINPFYTLPAIDFNTSYVKVVYNIIKYDNSDNKVTIQTPSGVIIKNGDNSTSYVLKNQYDIVKFIATEPNVYTRII